MTIIKGLKHFDEICPCILELQTYRFVGDASLLTFEFLSLIDRSHSVPQTAIGIIFGDQIDMIFGWIINNFFQPSNIWMLKRRKYLELFCETIMNFLLLQNHFIHLFQSILRVTPGILAKIHCRKRALTELLFHQVRIYHIFAAKILRLLNFIQGGNSSDSGFSFSNRLCLASA